MSDLKIKLAVGVAESPSDGVSLFYRYQTVAALPRRLDPVVMATDPYVFIGWARWVLHDATCVRVPLVYLDYPQHCEGDREVLEANWWMPAHAGLHKLIDSVDKTLKLPALGIEPSRQ